MDIKRLQRDLKGFGYYDGIVDGLWGPLSEAAYMRLRSLAANQNEPEIPAANPDAMAWGKKVSSVFKERLRWTASALELPREGADWLMACMAFETGETFRADIRNAAGSGATGLIQFMPRTAIGLGTTTTKLAAMTPEDQINYVYKYFLPYKGRLKNLGDMYMAILWPAGIGKSDDWKLWCKTTRETTYLQNRGLDVNKDGCITREEAVSKVKAKLVRGRQFYYG